MSPPTRATRIVHRQSQAGTQGVGGQHVLGVFAGFHVGNANSELHGLSRLLLVGEKYAQRIA